VRRRLIRLGSLAAIVLGACVGVGVGVGGSRGIVRGVDPRAPGLGGGEIPVPGPGGGDLRAPGPLGGSARGETAAVVDHVVDGDTLDVRLAGRFERVRTVQIDAPESSTLRFGHADRCGAPSKAFAETLTRRGATVWLEFSGRDLIDRYGRLLALVHLGGPGGETWQERMVRSGWAEVLVYRGNWTRLLGVLDADQAYAKAHELGVYARCGGSFHDGAAW
jgi:endonuclease YncB( thermonuclease family)